MKKILLFTLPLFLMLNLTAQEKKNYLSVETGGFFGNNNANLISAMKASGFDKRSEVDFLGLFTWTTDYPRKHVSGSQYRVRTGRMINHTKSIEAGFGQIY